MLISYLKVIVICIALSQVFSWSGVGQSSPCDTDPNCIFYQVTAGTLADLGCTRCRTGFFEQAGESGAGPCVAGQTIPGCLWEESNQDYPTRICWECRHNQLLSEDQRMCYPASTTVNRRIDNCVSYIVLNGNIVCNNCQDNFTLSQDQMSCTRGCSIYGCNSCLIIEGVTQCFDCANGLIGTYDSETTWYTSCLKCNQVTGKGGKVKGTKNW